MDITHYAEHNGSTWARIALIISSVLLSVSLLIAHENPATGYESSVFTGAPIIVWVLIYICFGIGISVILTNLIASRNDSSNIWLLGLAILILSRIVMLYIPYVRGYLSWWDDHISYLGMTKDILANSHIGSSNFYPITHILFAEVTLFTGIQPNIVENLSTATISAFFVMSTFLLASVIFKDVKYRIIAVLIAASVLLTGPYNVVSAPNGLSILILPFLFYLYFKQSSQYKYGILLIILLLMYPFFHPLSASILILALFVLMFFKWFAPRTFTGDTSIRAKFNATAFFLFEVGIFIMWVSSFSILRHGVEQAWYQISEGIGSGQWQQIGESLNKLNIFGFDILLLLLKMYGAEIILTLIAGIGILLILKRPKGNSAIIQNIGPLSIIFFIFGSLFLAFLFGLPGTQVGAGQQDRRFLGYFEILLPIYASFAFFQMSRFDGLRRVANLVFIPMIFVTLTLSIAALFPSSFISQPNTQVTNKDMTGMNWFIDEKDPHIYVTFISLFPFRFSDAILGYEKTHTERLDISYSREALPDHFGYPDFNTLGEQFIENRYMSMTKYDRTVYTTIWEQVGRYVEMDFDILTNDETVNRLYSNGETSFYLIRSRS